MSPVVATASECDLDSVFRREAGRVTATLIRVLGDVDLAEDAVAEAFAIAAERWPTAGTPANPGGWLTLTARNRAIDRLRRDARREAHQAAAHRVAAPSPVGDPGSAIALAEPGPDLDSALARLDALGDVVPDDQLRLVFLCCHPSLSPDAQVALTLRLLGGLQTTEIARAFLVPEPTMAQRLVRAKRKLRDNRAGYRIPEPAELPQRLHAALSTLYLVFTEGHTATSGERLTRTDLSSEAIRLARVLLALVPSEPEARGLLALMLLTEARRPARLDADGRLVRLADQDRSQWDRRLVAEGHELVRACLRVARPGPFQVQAAVAAVHADAASWADTDWSQIVALYDQLYALRPDAVVALNRAIAVAERDGAAAGLVALDAAGAHATRLRTHVPYHATRADLLARIGRTAAAVAAYDRAIDLTTNPVEQAFLVEQRDEARARTDGHGSR